MSVEANKAFVQRYVEEPWNKGNVDALDELCAPNFDLEGIGVEEFKAVIRDFRKSFPDLHFTVEEIIAEGDKVAYRWTARGTHQGEYEDIAPTGKTITSTGITIIRIVDGKVVDDRFESGGPTIREQLMGG